MNVSCPPQTTSTGPNAQQVQQQEQQAQAQAQARQEEHDSVMDRSVRLNNAGADCMEAGNFKMAWDLFKGSLELKLALERRGKQQQASPLGGHNQEMSSSTTTSSEQLQQEEEQPRHHPSPPLEQLSDEHNAYVQRAEEHLWLLEQQVRQGEGPPAPQQPSPMEWNSSSNNNNNANSNISNYDDGCIYTPFLYSHPLRLERGTSGTSRRDSATIIFNLALVDQLKHRGSQQAVALYELAMTLLTGDAVDLLGIALVNNIGVWCYENGDEDGALTCMGHLSTFIRACGDCIDARDQEGLHSNILWLLNPPFGASPAA